MKRLAAGLFVAALLLPAGCYTPVGYTSGADLAIATGDVLVYPAPVIAGRATTIEVKVSNLGREASASFKVGVYLDGHLLDEPLLVNNLDPNESLILEKKWIPADARQYRLEVRADIFDQILEAREYNNTRIKFVPVQAAAGGVTEPSPAETAPAATRPPTEPIPPTVPTPAPADTGKPPASRPQIEYAGTTPPVPTPTAPAGQPDLAIDLARLTYSAAPQLGQTITLSAEISNEGAAEPARPFTVQVFINGTLLPVIATVNYLPPGDQVVLNLPWQPTTEGWTEVKIVIDPDGLIAESTRDNNLAKRNLYVRP